MQGIMTWMKLEDTWRLQERVPHEAIEAVKAMLQIGMTRMLKIEQTMCRCTQLFGDRKPRPISKLKRNHPLWTPRLLKSPHQPFLYLQRILQRCLREREAPEDEPRAGQ
jgi:hypothetical protein